MNNKVGKKEVDPMFAQATKLIRRIEDQRNKSTVLSLICFDRSLTSTVAYSVNKLLRKIGNVEYLDLFLESGGGDIDVAAKIVKLCRAYCKKFSVLIPFYAKSAATLIAVWADEIVMTKSAELGPVDPQVHHPALDVWMPAHSIRDALTFIESTKDPFVKLTMADKLDPLLIGAFEDAQNATHQYITEAFALAKGKKKKNDAIAIFTTRYKSHGYPIDRDLCKKETDLKIIYSERELENLMSDLHELYLDRFLSQRNEKALVIQTATQVEAEIDKEVISISLPEQRKFNKKESKVHPAPKSKK